MKAKAVHQLIQQVTEGTLTVGIFELGIALCQFRNIIMYIAIMGKNPLPPPKFTAKRMGIFQVNFALSGFAYMRNHIAGFDRIITHQFSNRRFNRRLVIDEQTAGLIFKESNTNTIRMIRGNARPLGKSAEGKSNIRRGGTIHSEQLAHGLVSAFYLLRSLLCMTVPVISNSWL